MCLNTNLHHRELRTIVCQCKSLKEAVFNVHQGFLNFYDFSLVQNGQRIWSNETADERQGFGGRESNGLSDE